MRVVRGVDYDKVLGQSCGFQVWSGPPLGMSDSTAVVGSGKWLAGCSLGTEISVKLVFGASKEGSFASSIF